MTTLPPRRYCGHCRPRVVGGERRRGVDDHSQRAIEDAAKCLRIEGCQSLRFGEIIADNE